MATKNSLRDLYSLRHFLIHKRFKSVELIPKLKDRLNPPPPKAKAKNIPKLEDIKIPMKIERSPTDILKALASTVGRDYTAPHYKFHDDPYLIPYSNMSKRSYALSKEAGRKAAKWIRQEHSNIFDHQVSEPPIESFFPSPVFTEESELSETDLVNYIEQGLVAETIEVYNILQTKKQPISDTTRHSVLELLCYFNELEQTDEDLIEERWYKSSNAMRDRLKNTWKDGGLAEEIFKSFENPPVSAYCAMIRGQAKFFNSGKAWVTYTEGRSKLLTFDTETYNSLLKSANFLRENADLRLALIEELLLEMRDNGVQPNLRTLNAVLESLSMIGNAREAKIASLSFIAEFKQLGVEPCLATYYYLLTIYCKERGPVSTMLIDVMKMIKGKEFTIQDPKDIFFFVMAMDIARNHIQNVEIAHQVDDLLHTGNNYDLIGDSFKESVYYRHYMALRCVSEPFEDFMKFYNKIVPNIYTPEPVIMEEILKALEINSAISFLPQLWSDIIIFDQSTRENLLALVLQIMSEYYPTLSDDISQPETEKLREQFTSIGWKIWSIIENQERDRGRQINWSGKMLGDLLTIEIKGEKFENACEIIKKLLSPSAALEVVGVPSIQTLKLFLDTAIIEKKGAMCLACLQYVNDCGFPEVRQFGQEVLDNVPLDSLQSSKLSSITGIDIEPLNEQVKMK